MRAGAPRIAVTAPLRSPPRAPGAVPPSRTPLVEIRGPWLHNKGDDLMLRACVEALGGRFALAAEGGLGLARLPRGAGVDRLRWSELKAARLSRGFMTRGGRAGALRDAALLALPEGLRTRLRLRDGREVSGLVDASGFAYGDQWNVQRMRRRAAYYAMLRGRGVRFVLAPQALGPFETPEGREAARALLLPFDRVYARDARSLGHLAALDLPPGVALQAPDVSHLLAPAPLPPGDWARRACVVPNARMIDRTDPATSGRYVAFLLLALRLLRERGAEPFVMLHETNDAGLATEIARQAGGLEVIDPPALVAKALLGACRAVVSSRYHALAGALSQATPTIGTSWSHKYDALFEEYRCPEMLVSPLIPEESLRDRLDRALDAGPRDALRARLAAAALRQSARVEAMWEDTRAILAGEAPASR